MQNELDGTYPELAVQILGCNEVGLEHGNPSITSGRDIPWLQDIDKDMDGQSDVWTSWEVVFRDVIIVDRDNLRVAAFNLTMNSLAIPENYETLKQLFVETALVSGDVNLDGRVGLLDVGPFVDLISSGSFQLQADINRDGVVDFKDVNPLVELLTQQ